MTPRAKNIAVGVTVIAALVVLGVLIVMLTGLPQIFQGGYYLKIKFPVSSGAKAGDAVYFQDIQVGTVTRIDFANPEDLTQGVLFTIRISEGTHLPANIQGEMFSKGLTGSPYLALTVIGGSPARGGDGKPLYLPTSGVTIPGIQKSSSLIPPELVEAVDKFSKLGDKLSAGMDKLGGVAEELRPALASLTLFANNLNALFFPGAACPAAPGSTTAPAGGTPQGGTAAAGGTTTAPATTTAPEGGVAATTAPAPPADLRQMLARLDHVLTGLDNTIGRPETQKNLQATLDNLAKASAQMQQTMQAAQLFLLQVSTAAADMGPRIKTLTDKLVTDAEEASRLLASLRKTVQDVNEGKGTLGKLVTNDQLYNNLLTVTDSLNKTLADLQTLLKDWQAGGVRVKMR